MSRKAGDPGLASEMTSDILESGLYSIRQEIPPEIRDDPMRRNPGHRRYVLDRCHPSSPNILVRDLRGVDSDLGCSAQFPDARGYVTPLLPGYSRDGGEAVFLFGFGPTPHGAVGFHRLRRANGRWEIARKRLGDYDRYLLVKGRPPRSMQGIPGVSGARSCLMMTPWWSDTCAGPTTRRCSPSGRSTWSGWR